MLSMATVQIEVPNELVEDVSTLAWEQWLKLLRTYQKNQEDINLVHQAMKNDTESMTLDQYLNTCEK